MEETPFSQMRCGERARWPGLKKLFILNKALLGKWTWICPGEGQHVEMPYQRKVWRGNLRL